MRAQVEKRYASEVSRAYEDGAAALEQDDINGGDNVIILDDDIPAIVLNTIKRTINSQDSVPDDADLFSFGVDSVACMQIRAFLQTKILPSTSPQLPLNFVYDCGTIDKISRYLIGARKGQSIEKEDEVQLMRDLVKEYSSFHDKTEEFVKIFGNGIFDFHTSGQVAILTGATGALGAHILALLRDSPRVSQIHCLVRAATESAAHERVFKSLRARRKDASSSDADLNKKIFCHPFKLSDPFLGLPKRLYKGLADRTTTIIHAAWAVNFSMRLPSFVKDHINGLRNLIGFALTSPSAMSPRFVFCSSTASVLGPHATSPVQESISDDPLAASPLGYSRSKWVAEAICDVVQKGSELRGNLAVLRIGQLCGDTQHGVWNQSEAWPLMLGSVKVTGILPELKDDLGWLPVDIAAKAVLEIALAKDLCQHKDSESETPVYHVLNPCKQTNWSDLLRWMHRLAPGFETLTPSDWVVNLDGLEGEARHHPARKLIGLWREAYCNNQKEDSTKEATTFTMENTMKIAPSMRDIKPIDEELFEKLWTWIEKTDSGASSH
ncbi:hypothetical protein P7C71_g2397, partial [Lecanoromycetidae sp. Uapishka_2]